jgi:PTH1 family peptidyl-tRNA hydrolase
MSDERFLVVGLGNPGPRYAATRHNAGFFVLDELADRVGGSFRVHKASGGRAEVVEGRLAGRPAVLVKPRSYMNESGGPVVSISRSWWCTTSSTCRSAPSGSSAAAVRAATTA